MINNAKSTWQNQNCLEECNKLCKYQTRYLVRTFIFIISTWCVYHAIHYVLQLLIPIGTNIVSWPQVSRSGHFLRFYDFIGFISWFLKKWRPVRENWSQGSGLMTGYVAQNYFLGPRPQGQVIFWDFMILLDFSHDSWKNEVLFVKIGVRIPDLWLDTSSGPKWPKFSLQTPGPTGKTFFEI